MNNFVQSHQAEVLRAAQKDDLHSNHVHELLSDVIFKLAGNRVWLKWRSVVQVAGKLAYYSLTTLSNFQTIGEEYTGIVQVDETLRQVPSKMTRLVAILVDVCGLHLFVQALLHLENELKHTKPGSELTPNAREKLLQAIETVRALIPSVQRFHKAVFFWSGSHYCVGKRLAGIHYVSVRPRPPDPLVSRGFRLLGAVSLLYLLARGGRLARGRSRGRRESADSRAAGPASRCSLCMEERVHPAVTPCGHLFCWSCVLQWLQANPRCPMCREVVTPSRVILLQNYS